MNHTSTTNQTSTTNWPPPPPSTLNRPARRVRGGQPITAILVVAAVTLAFADASIVSLALPDLYLEFGTTIPAVSWVLTGYALAVAVAGLVCLALLRRIDAFG